MVGIVYCEFDQKLGPMLKFSIPKITKGFGDEIALKSIDLLSSEEIMNSKALAFFPFPAQKKKGILRCIEWKDETLRGSVGTSSLTLLFDEGDDVIFYKYNKDFEILFDTAAKKIIDLNTQEADTNTLEAELKKIHEMFQNQLKKLKDQEIGIKDDSEAFPEQKKSKDRVKYTFKVVVCGDPACGKTSTVLRFTDKAFKRTYIPSVGVNITRKKVIVDGKKVFLVLWDIAGQQKFSFIRGQFYEGAKGVLILFDITREKTFNNVRGWYNDVKKFMGYKSSSIDILCGNKIDLKDKRKITNQKAVDLANELEIPYFETSALTGENIDDIFYTIAKTLADTIKE